MRYGLPYKGSKNAIAKWVIEQLPKADTLVDLFCGGGAITHCAMLSGKWNNFIMNDIDARLPVLFKDCIDGKYTVENHSEWIDRETFNKLKDTDAYIALVWSFGNNGEDYLYGTNIETFRAAYHRAVYSNDVSLLEPYGYKIKPSDKDNAYERYSDFKRQIRDTLGGLARCVELESLQRLQSLESLHSLHSLHSLQSLESLQSYGVDYREIDIPAGAVIYCDIPYSGTNCGKYKSFNHSEFYEWAMQQDNIYISEYQMPEGFIPIAQKIKPVLSSTHGTNKYAVECIFTNHRTYDKLTDDRKEIIKSEMEMSE